MLDQHVDALIHQRVGGGLFLARIVPGADPDDFKLRLGIDLLHAEHDRIDVADYFRDREGRDITDLGGLAHAGRHETRNISPLIGQREIGAEILGPLIARGVLENDIGKAPGDFGGRVHVTE